MNRSLTALFAALEAVLVVGVGIGISLLPLTVMWAAQYGFAIDWVVFWRAAVDIWLVGHGVDLQVTLDTALSTGLGMPDGTAFPVTIAPLGFALLTLLLAVRAGRRVGETRYRNLGSAVSLLTFAALSTVVTLTALYPLARPSIAQGMALPSLVFGLGFVVGLLRTRRAEGDDSGSSLRDWINDWSPFIREAVRTALVGGAAVVAGILAVGSILLALLIAVNYAQVISLYEGLHGGALGGLALTIGELSVMPNLVIWVASWLVGPGFAIGAGSAVSPLGTTLGPIPAIPVLGALPTAELPFGFVGLLVPIVTAFLVAAVLRPRLARAVADADYPLAWLGGASLGMGVVAGVVLGLLAMVSGGAAGPGRLVEVGPDPLAVGLWAALEVTVAAGLAMVVSRQRAGER
jgi:hypothetical protein